MQNLEEWLQWIKSLSLQEIDLSLDRVKEVLRRLDLSLQSTAITIAGTNGKGSTVRGLEAIYTQGGFSVGAYTSPYLLHYNEQVRIHGIPCDDLRLCKAFAKIKAHAEDICLTPFEFGTLAALLIFAESRLDVVLLEVGLGGRLDAVNAIDPDVSIVTSVAIDHVEWLGRTREAIGREKAGIFRKNRPAICGDFLPPTSLLQYADEIQALLFCQNKQFMFHEKELTWDWRSENLCLENLPKPLLALQNMSTVLMCVELLQSRLPIKEDSIRKVLKTVNLPGRIQLVPGKVPQIWDVSHNPASCAMLADYLAKNPVKGKTQAVFSMLKDKDIEETILVIEKNIHHWHIAPLPEPRGISKDALLSVFAKKSNWTMYENIADAHKKALQDACQWDRVVVFGSFRTVAEVSRTRPFPPRSAH